MKSNARLLWSTLLGLAVGAPGLGVGADESTPTRPGASIRITAENPSSIQEGIEAAGRAGMKRVVIPAGTYRLPKPNGGAYLSFRNLADLEIDARGVTLLRTDPTKGGINFNRCRNVTVNGMTLLNETPPFTQGTLVGIDPDGRWLEVRIDQGYPANFDDPQTGEAKTMGDVFDPRTRQWKVGTVDYGVERPERLGPGLFRLNLQWRVKPASQPVSVGDLMAFRGRLSTDIFLGECSGMVITNVTILHGSGFCVHESGGEGGNHYSYKVTYGPKPAGATASPLIACNADAFHSSGVRKGPIVENCLFEGMPDDGVPIHGNFALVMDSAGREVTLCLAERIFFRNGDPIRFFNQHGHYLAETTIREIATLNQYKPKSPITTDRFKRARRFVTLTLDKSVPVDFQCYASDPAANGSGYVVRNNIIRNHRARGMLLKADNGLVEGNTVDGSTIAGIVIAPEIWWNEAGYSRNVIVRKNVIRNTGYAAVGSSDYQAGALTVTGATGEPAKAGTVASAPSVQVTGTSSSKIIFSRTAMG